MVVDEQMAAIAKSHCVGAAVAVGQFHQRQRAPGEAVVGRPRFEEMILLGATQGLKSMPGMDQDAGLDGVNGAAVVDRPDAFPALAPFGVPLKCTCPALANSRPNFVLLGQRREPSSSSTGLFLIGPKNPFGSRSGIDQWAPSSADRFRYAQRFPVL